MTQTSRPVGEHSNNYASPPHDCGPYSSLQWRIRERVQETGDLYNGTTAAGPYYGYLNNLEVTTAAGDIIIDTGACFVDGNVLINYTSSVTISPAHNAASCVVVAILNDQNTTYDGTADALTLDWPTDLTDYNGLSSVPEYSCRLAVLHSGVATMIQTTTVFMVPLATFDIDGAGVITNLTQDTTVRTWVNAEIKYALVHAIVGYNLDTTTVIRNSITLNYVQPSLALPQGAQSFAYSYTTIPNDFISDLIIDNICGGSLAGGNVYIKSYFQSGDCGEEQSATSEDTGYLTEAIGASRTGYKCHAQLAVTDANVQPGEVVKLVFERQGNNVADTLADNLHFVAFRLNYLGYRR